MAHLHLPPLPFENWQETYNTLHDYTRALSAMRRALTPRQKHWSHISLRVNATGLTTTPIPAPNASFEIALDLATHRVTVATNRGDRWEARLRGQPLSEFWNDLTRARDALNIKVDVPKPDFPDSAAVYDPAAVERFWSVLYQLDFLFKQFQGELREETSPVQLWAHDFDLALLWFSGRVVPGQNSSDEEAADEQMNFGFAVVGADIPEAYFYITAYPRPDGFVGSPLPKGAYWHTQSWTGAVLPYRYLAAANDAGELLLDFFRMVQRRGAELMKKNQ
ncbi:MAG TPA: DUF5996 family protein [Anaerolineae bacterium]|nr:DUF5996 family protein [Anaerolineae bacterium]